MNDEIAGDKSTSLFQIPAIEIERFDDAALLFLTESEIFVTVNHAAADLLELLLTTFGHESFARGQLVDLLLSHFDLDELAVESKTDQILATWSQWNIVQPGDMTQNH